jgi:hypothetical protein
MYVAPKPVFAAALTLALAGLCACPRGQSAAPKAAPSAAAASVPPPPTWVTHVEVDNGKLCGVGVAGAGFDERSPYPKSLSRERAVRNLVGILGTSVLEATVDRATDSGQSVETARAVQIDEDLVAAIDGLAEVEYWLDRDALGPFAQKNFTYAYACVDAKKVSASLALDAKQLARAGGKNGPTSPDRVPAWMSRGGKQPGGRLCAVGFSLPMFFADNTFASVVEDIRAQLAYVLETLVSQYSEELTTTRFQAFEMMTVASTQAISKGAVVTDFWFDRDGRGPRQQKRSTYGFACVYPVDIIQQSLAAVQDKVPDQNAVAKVRERAAHAFDELDGEIAKHPESATAAGRQSVTRD